jgi:His/Glu/Gln/Arg/opine family amino acid ABC transporter permease subunit
MLWRGLGLTILVGLGAMGLAVTFGLLGAWGKFSRYRVARWLADTYTTVIRGVPELILILLVYYGVPTLIQDLAASAGRDLRVDLNPFVAGIATIGLIYGAFATEVFRGAFQAVPRGQIEAARAFGMGRVLMLRRVVLPQMWRFALPGLGNVWMVLIKATALISVIQLEELMRSADIAARATRLPFTFFFAASLFYLGITIASMLIQRRIESWSYRGAPRGQS